MKFTILILNMPYELLNKGLGRNFQVRWKKKKKKKNLTWPFFDAHLIP